MRDRVRQFKTVISKDDYMVRDHLVHGVRVLPGTFLLDLTCRMGAQVGMRPSAVELRECLFIEPITVTEGHDSELQINLDPFDRRALLSMESRRLVLDADEAEPWTKVLTVELLEREGAEPPPRLDIGAKKRAAQEEVDLGELYDLATSVDINYFEFMRMTGRAYKGADFVLAEATLSDLARVYLDHFYVHPVFLDFATLVSFYLLGAHEARQRAQPFVPMFIESFRTYHRSGESCWIYVERPGELPRPGDILRSDLALFDPDGAALATFEGFTAKRVRSQEDMIRFGSSRPAAPLARRAPSERPIPAERRPTEPPAQARPASGTSFAGYTAQDRLPSLLELIERDIRALLGEMLSRPPHELESHRGFYDEGLTSLDLLKVVNKLEARIGQKLYPTLLFERSTLLDLARYLVEEHGDAYAQTLSAMDASRRLGSPTQAARPDADAGSAQRVERVEARPEPGPQPAAGTGRRAAEGDIAIVGVAGRYPMARNVEEYWANLLAGRDCITEIPPSRWDWREDFDPERGKPGSMYSKWGGFIDGHDEFDALFFNISPREAETMDPHERLFLQTVWEAMEDAGYTRESLASSGGKVGVFAGVMWSDYQLFALEESVKGNPAFAESWFAYVANRVSYFLNLRGPSIALDTACSSSLSALHLACDSIRRGDCTAAIVGGVNLSLHPSKYRKLCELQVLSSDGRCRSFGNGGTGYVPGEGVGAILVKPLADAIAAGDQIHAVVKGSSINHGGRTSGFTVPSPDAQAQLVLHALDRAGVHPATLSYVEAHGTGTSLGDPIEIAGLTSAFRRFTPETGLCAIGSVKSNIGHLEAAAGMAAITKVLLCMKHRTLVPSLHSQELNPNIPLAASPFSILQVGQRWERPRRRVGGVEAEWPRRAGISSFGAGGSNAHVILEEYEDPASAAPRANAGAPELILLSAKNEDRLRARAQDLRRFLEVNREVRLEEIAYTLQVGREPMEARLAIVVRSWEELIRALDDYLQSREGPIPISRGQVRRGSSGLGADPEDQAYLRHLWESGKLLKIAALWTEGTPVDPRMFSERRGGRRISLPTYPFTPKRCWISQVAGGQERPERAAGAGQSAPGPHALLDANESTLSGFRFRKRLGGDEFFLADHLVHGRRVLPGAAYLEMARAAAAILGGAEVRAIEHMTWLSPLVVENAPVDAIIRLQARGGDVGFEVVSGHDPEVLHAKGKVSLGGGEQPAAPGPLDTTTLEQLQRRCRAEVSAEELYASLAARGLHYGPGLRSVERLYLGADEALAELRVPAHLEPQLGEYALHPSLLDGALQAVGGLLSRNAGSGSSETLLPYAVGLVRILGRPGARCFVRIAPSSKGAAAVDQRRFHLDVLDPEGRPVLLLRDLVVKAAPERYDRLERKAEPPRDGLLFYTPIWVHAPAPAPYQPPSGGSSVLLLFDRGEVRALALRRRLQHLAERQPPVILVEPGSTYEQRSESTYRLDPTNEDHYRTLLSDLRRRGQTPAGVLHLWNLSAEATSAGSACAHGAAAVEEQLRAGLSSVVLFARALPSLKLREAITLVYAVDGEEELPEHAAVAGFARSAMLENPKFAIKVVRVAPELRRSPAAWDALLEDLQAREAEVLRDVDARLMRTFTRVAAPEVTGLPSLLRRRGAYLITGGAGGLGLVFARYLAQEAQARITLVGRSPLDGARQAALQEIAALGGEAHYLSADITDAAGVERCVQQALERFGVLHGVLHAAGVLADAFLATKPLDAFQRVLAPKVAGTLHLDRATAGLQLDCMLLFSSVSGVLGNIGQTDYAAGNRFLDSFAVYREELRRSGKRQGRTLSINWPLWRAGGMKIHPDVEAMILSNLGIRVLETDKGLSAFAAACGMDTPQVMAVDADAALFEARLGLPAQAAAEPPPAAAPAEVAGPRAAASLSPQLDEREIEAVVLQDLSAICAGLLKLPEAEIDVDVEFGDYGIESMMVIRILERVEARFGTSLGPSIIIDNPTLRKLTRALMSQEVVVQTVRSAAAAGPTTATAGPTTATAPLERGPVAPPAQSGSSTNGACAPELPPQGVAPRAGASRDRPRRIAVIAMACRFPESATLEDYWDNLIAGRDLITPVPTDRWDVERYSGKRGEKNKTCSRWGGFLKDVDRFDADFFGIPEAEAAWLDPQQRLVLELTQELVGRAGYTRREIEGSRAGVFIGGSSNDYVKANYAHQQRSTPSLILCSIQNMLAARVSHFYNLRGPSVVMDTACSSSLVAIHHACRSILSGESEIAIAGGAQLLLEPFVFVALNQAQMLSEDGRTRVFDRQANGMSLGEGIGLVLLKDYDRALQDGDMLLGTILGSAVNNDGRTMSMMMPSKDSQMEVIGAALGESGISAADISYLETHGSGNSFGDPIEIHAAAEVYRRYTERREYCAVGSVKSNMGSLLQVSGAASLIKVLLALQHRRLPPTIHCETPHPRFQFVQTPFYPVRSAREWEPIGGRRVGAVSSFGLGGTNAHVIVEEIDHGRSGYQPTRQPLLRTPFNGKRLWLDIQKRGLDPQGEATEGVRL